MLFLCTEDNAGENIFLKKQCTKGGWEAVDICICKTGDLYNSITVKPCCVMTRSRAIAFYPHSWW